MAKEFAAQGARLFLSGRTGSEVQAVADAISADGRTRRFCRVGRARRRRRRSPCRPSSRHGRPSGHRVQRHGPAADRVRQRHEHHGPPDREVHAPRHQDRRVAVHHGPFCRAAQVREGSGVLIFLSATVSRGVSPNTSAMGTAYGAVESMTRSGPRSQGSRGSLHGANEGQSSGGVDDSVLSSRHSLSIRVPLDGHYSSVSDPRSPRETTSGGALAGTGVIQLDRGRARPRV